MSLFSTGHHFRLAGINLGHFKVHYKGIKAIKCPFDYVLYQMLVWSVQPDLIIEIGTNEGGGALYLADLLELTGKGEVHTIDMATNNENAALHKHPRIKIYKEGYERYDTSALGSYKKIMVIEDASHMYEDSLAALRKFSPFVGSGSYYIVEDGIVTELGRAKEFNGGPQRAVREFMQGNNEFTIDRSYCDFFGKNATFNVNGYLKKR